MYILNPADKGFIEKLIDPNFAKLEELANRPTQRKNPILDKSRFLTREDRRKINRERFPDLAEFIDKLRESFGADQVKVVNITYTPQVQGKTDIP